MKKKKFKAIKNEAVENKASHKKRSGSLKLALTLFLSYFKIGLFTFGGGYAMIALIEREFVAKKKWITEGELYEIIAISESTPGPLAINCATFVGYKIMKFWGSLISTVAVCIPSFAIIYLISVFYDQFMALTPIAYAFEGIKVGIAVMITIAGFNMIRKGDKNLFSMGVFLLTFAAATCIDIFSLEFSTIYLILIGAELGIILQIARDIINKKRSDKIALILFLDTPDFVFDKKSKKSGFTHSMLSDGNGEFLEFEQKRSGRAK